MASRTLGIHQNKGVKVSTSQIWGSSVLSKASSFLFVTEEAAQVNLDYKPGEQAGKGEKIKYFLSPVQHGECVQSAEGQERMNPCHSSLFIQGKRKL